MALKRYVPVVFVSGVAWVITFLVPERAGDLGVSLVEQGLTMLMVLPPIFLLLGLLDVWVPRDTLVKFMGPGSGFRGTALAFFVGSAAAGPLYGAFPVAAVLMKKGASFTNILVFLGAWSTTKIPMFLFEIQSLGPAFALTRLIVNVPGIFILARILETLVPKKEIRALYP